MKELGADSARLGVELVEALTRAGWSGGVPELRSCLAQALEESEGGPLHGRSLVAKLQRARPRRPSLPSATDPSLAKARLEDALSRANGSVASAARALGMSRQAIYREAERLRLELARKKVRALS